MYVYTYAYGYRENYTKKVAQALSGEFRPGTTRLTKYFQILTRNLSEKPSSKKIDFFGTHF